MFIKELLDLELQEEGYTSNILTFLRLVYHELSNTE